MPFNSWLFSIFFMLTAAGFFALKRTKFWQAWLLLASYVFYGWLNPLYVPMILWTTALNYLAGRKIESSPHKNAWLTVALVNNLLILGVFKYAVFAVENMNTFFGAVGMSYTLPVPGQLLPIGLSFYTFIATGYIIDCWRGTVPAEKNFIRFAAFVSFFPYLLAGPIERAKNMLPQLKNAPAFKSDQLTEGLSLFVTGLFKKIALADFLALYVNRVYGEPAEAGGLVLLMATYAFAWQIYFDFSGYTDMARGCARMLGFELMLNFKNPYLAESLGEFWGRWHISLSSWFRDYLYIPLGGNRKGRIGTYRNMIITMLVAGLWHGAAWNFVIWGGIHALGRSIMKELENTRFYAERIPKFMKQMLVFHIVCLAWIFFRAETFGKAIEILTGIFTRPWNDPAFPIAGFIFILSVWAYQFIFESRLKRALELSYMKIALMTLMLLYMIFFRTAGYEIFLYFRF